MATPAYAEQIQALVETHAAGAPYQVKIFGDAYSVPDIGNFLPNNIIITINDVVAYQKVVLSQILFMPTLAENALKVLEKRDEFLKLVLSELQALWP